MAGELMYIPKNYTQNYPFCSVKLLKLNKLTNQNSLEESPKLLS